MEAIEYANSLADLEAYSLYHLKRSPVGRRSLRMSAIIVGAIILLGSLILSFPNLDVAALLLSTIGAVAGALVYPSICARAARTQTRRHYSSGRNMTVFGWHRLTLLDDELREENEGGSRSVRYEALEGVAETESHVFVFVTTVSAYVIPKNAVSSGALDSFVARLRERIEGAGGRA